MLTHEAYCLVSWQTVFTVQIQQNFAHRQNLLNWKQKISKALNWPDPLWLNSSETFTVSIQGQNRLHQIYMRSVILTLWLCYCERQGVRLLSYLPHSTVLIITLSKRSYEPELNFMWSVSARTTNVWAHLTEFMFLMILKSLKCTNLSGRLGIHFFKK